MRRIVSMVFAMAVLPVLPVGAHAAPILDDQPVTADGQDPTPEGRPNIVVFYLDDTAAHDGRLWKDSTLTPTIYDTFVAHGFEFTHAYAEDPLCCPARASLLTGLHTHNNLVFENDARLFHPQTNIGTALSEAGYATMFIGKYLNRSWRLSDDGWAANSSGWTTFDVLDGVNHAYTNYEVSTKDTGIIPYGTYHSTRMVGDRAVARMREVPAEQPIFQVLSIVNMHAPNTPAPQPPGRLALCDSMPPYLTAAFNEVDVSDKPSHIRRSPLLTNSDGSVMTDGWSMVQHCQEMLGVDDMVKQVTDELAAQGRLENTLLVFTADNGMGWGAHRLVHKMTPYATQVPLYMTWPAAWGSAGRVADAWTSNIDLAPTFCALAGCELGPYPTGQAGPDGISLVPYLTMVASGEDARHPARTGLLEQMIEWSAIRTTSTHPRGLWHYIAHTTGERELYDLSGGPCYAWTIGDPGDPCELRNRAGDPAFSDIAMSLQAELDVLRRRNAVPFADASIATASSGIYKGIRRLWSVPVDEQTLTRTGVAPGTTSSYFVMVRNRGPGDAHARLTAIETGSVALRVTYRIGTRNITSDVIGPGRQVRIAAGSTLTVVIRVRVLAGAPPGQTRRVLLQAASTDSPDLVDVVRAITRTFDSSIVPPHPAVLA